MSTDGKDTWKKIIFASTITLLAAAIPALIARQQSQEEHFRDQTAEAIALVRSQTMTATAAVYATATAYVPTSTSVPLSTEIPSIEPPSVEATQTATEMPSVTPTSISTDTPTSVPIATFTPLPTYSPTILPTHTEIVTPSDTPTVIPTPIPPAPSRTPQPSSSSVTDDDILEFGQTYLGQTAEGATTEYRFIGKENVPIIITLAIDPGGPSLDYIIKAPNGLELVSDTLFSNQEQRSIPVTPPRDGEYILILYAWNGFGGYSVYLGTQEVVDHDMPIELEFNASYSAETAVGATTEYTFMGTRNVPIIITIAIDSGGLGLAYTVMSPNGEELISDKLYSNQVQRQIPITPPMDGLVRLVIRGELDFGRYSVFVEEQNSSSSDPNAPIAIEFNMLYSGQTAAGAITEYTFTGIKNEPIIITLAVDAGGPDILYTVVAPNGAELVSDRLWNIQRQHQIPITPSMDGEHAMILQADSGFGGFTIYFE